MSLLFVALFNDTFTKNFTLMLQSVIFPEPRVGGSHIYSVEFCFPLSQLLYGISINLQLKYKEGR